MPARLFTDDQQATIAASYVAGLSSLELASERGCGGETIRNILRRQGVTLRQGFEAQEKACLLKRILSPERATAVVTDYLARVPPREIRTKYGISQSTLTLTLKRHGVPAHPPGRRCALNESAFDDMSDPQAQYFAGLLFADGCVCWRLVGRARIPRACISLSLNGKDGEHVGALQDFLQTNYALLIRPGRRRPGSRKRCKPCTYLQVLSNRLAEALARYGVLPRKSLTGKAAEEMVDKSDWWRGVVDGDGWVSFRNGRPRIGLCGSLGIVEQFLAFAASFVPTWARPQAHGNMWKVDFRRAHAIPVVRALYDGCAVALPRKREAAKRILSA